MARLEALPYTRWCVGCAEAVSSGFDASPNRGRPETGKRLAPPDGDDSRRESRLATDADARDEQEECGDSHAIGVAGGGTGIGGLAGTNSGNGDSDESLLQSATATVAFAGSLLTATVDRRWIPLTMAVTAFLFRHAVQG